ncbi:hypothetical protein Gpo141_00012235 [Globisporangium polare]
MDETGARGVYEEQDGDEGDSPQAEEDEDAADNDEQHAGEGDSDPDGDEGDDEGEDPESEDEELEREWAATEIQHAWRTYYYDHKPQQDVEQAADLSVDPSAPPPERSKKKSESVCCSCFGLIDEPTRAAEGNDDDQVFCTACLYVMARTIATLGPATPSVASPLPKLSMLVQAEAKYQDQLQMLRAKQELLRQQQEEMQNRKSTEAKQLVAERALARERRRLFQLSMERKKREEELKYQQLSSNSTSSPEQDDGDASVMTPQSAANNSSSKRKKMKEMIPIPLRRTLQLAAAAAGVDTSSTSPRTTMRLPGLTDKKHQEQRKTRFFKKMVGCYAQDLTPLVNGHKPKLLPVSSPSAVPAKKSASHQHQQSPSLSRTSSQTKAKAPASRKKQQQQMLKSKKPAKLHPIDARGTRKLSNSSNQHDDHENTASSSSSFSSYSRLSTQPLTAEIKPVSWIYELGKGVLDEEPHDAMTGGYQQQNDAAARSQSLGRFAQLDSVQEERNEATDTRASFDLRLQHKLPAKTVLAPSSTASLPPTAAPTSISVSMGQQLQPQWEYSTDRLAGLLEKYNVSVTTATK